MPYLLVYRLNADCAFKHIPMKIDTADVSYHEALWLCGRLSFTASSSSFLRNTSIVPMTSYFKLSFRPKVVSVSAPFDSKKVIDGQRRIMKTSYTCKPVEFPPDFLKITPPDAQPIVVERVNFAASAVPEYAPYYATVLDNVLSASECAELLRLAMLSAPSGDWEPAMVNAGAGYEILATDVRHCDRYCTVSHFVSFELFL